MHSKFDIIYGTLNSGALAAPIDLTSNKTITDFMEKGVE